MSRDIRSLSVGDRFSFVGEKTVYEYRGNGWFDGPGGGVGGPWYVPQGR